MKTFKRFNCIITINTWKFVLAILCCLVFCREVVRAEQPQTRLFLVRATAIDRVDGLEDFVTTLKITHVYDGDSSLVGRTFEVTSSRNEEGNMVFEVIPPVAVGEVGIWPIIFDKKTLQFRRGDVGEWQFPARKGISSQFQERQLLAEAIEQVFISNEDVKFRLLEQFAFSTTPIISAWAIRQVPKYDKISCLRVLNELLSKQLSNRSAIALDASLSESSKEEWLSSTQRTELLLRIFSKELNEDDAKLCIQRLDIAAQNHEISDQLLVSCTDAIVKNSSVIKNAHEGTLWFLRNLPKRMNDGNAAVEELSKILLGEYNNEMKIAAIEGLKNVEKPNASSIKRLADIKKTGNDLLKKAIESIERVWLFVVVPSTK